MLKMELRTVRYRAHKLGVFLCWLSKCMADGLPRGADGLPPNTNWFSDHVRGRTDLIGHVPGVRNC
jgi:hypothetical protein